MLEQLLGLQRLAEEYGKVAKEDIGDNTKLSVLLRVMPAAVRQHLQLQMTEDTSYTRRPERRCWPMSEPPLHGGARQFTKNWPSPRTTTSTMR